MSETPIEIQFSRDKTLPELARDSCTQSSHREIYNHQFSNAHSLLGKKKKILQKKYDLQELITKNKVKALVQNFAKKLRRNSIHRPVVDNLDNFQENYYPSNNWKSIIMKLGQNKGLFLNNFLLTVWSFSNIIQITVMVFVFSIMLAFEQTVDFQLFLYFRITSVFLYIIDMILNFTTQRYERGKRLQTLGEISDFYLQNGFVIDLISILIFPIDLFVNSNITIFISFVALVKLANSLNKFQKFEYTYINTSGKEQYYGLIKVFLTNFAIGHFLSIILNLMTSMQTEINWVVKLGITNQPWFTKYVWGYYWGTNIMLTVGFGDITATNQYEAIVLVFIETFSCITLAYNISYVGALIGFLRQKDEAKKKKLKTFYRMCKQNEISTEVQTKLSNFIEQSYRIKETFSYDDEDEVLEYLPKSMQSEYRKQTNQTLFDNLGFLSNMSRKSLLKLAESVSRKICHPEQLVIKKGSISDFIILQKGQLGLACKCQSNLDGRIIDTISTQQNHNPKIFSLDFIKNKICNYNVKSIKYSVLYYLSRQQFMQSLRNSQMDYQLFCVLRDRDEYIIDENNLYQCPFCKNQYHNKFECSKLHYFPIKQNVIYRLLHSSKTQKQNRKHLARPPIRFSTFSYLKESKQAQKMYIKNNYDEEQYQKMENVISFYQNLNNAEKKNFISFSTQHDMKIIKTATKIYNIDFASKQQQTINLLESYFNMNNAKQAQFWDLQCDEAHNFRYYFEKGNPTNLAKGRKIRKRSTKGKSTVIKNAQFYK